MLPITVGVIWNICHAHCLNDRGLYKKEEFGLDRLKMDGPITRARSKRFQ